MRRGPTSREKIIWNGQNIDFTEAASADARHADRWPV